MVSDKHQFPKITKEMHEEMAEWYKTHNNGRCANAYHGAIGGNVSFHIIPTSIGNFIDVKCSCGAVLSWEEV